MAELGTNPFYFICDKTPASDLAPKDRQLLTVHESLSIQDAISFLHQHKISSCPVLNDKDFCIGSIDFFSILKTRYANLESEPRTVRDVIDRCSPLVPFFINNPISLLIDLFTTCHRVVLFKKDKEMVCTLSQSDVIRFLSQVITDVHEKKAYTARYADTITKFISQPLTGMKIRNAHSIGTDTSMRDALLTMTGSSYRALAIIDPTTNQLLADIRVSKLHELLGVDDSTLDLPAIQWVQQYSPSYTTSPPCIAASATYGDALQLIALTRVHHLWVLDENDVPAHIVTMTDLLKLLQTSHVTARSANGDFDLSTLWKLN